MNPETVYRTAFLVLLIALLVMRVYFMVKVRRAGERILPDDQAIERQGGYRVFILRILLFFALIAFLVMYFAGAAWIDTASFFLPAWLRWAGFGLGFAAVIFWGWAQIYLDTQWSAELAQSEEPNLITSGPYAFVRHPLYLGMIAWAIAVCLLTANWFFVAICGFSILGLVWRIPREERMLIETYGDEYRTYMQRAGRFYPKL